MISTTRINYELLRCINIRYKIIELYTDAILIGHITYIHKYAKDVMTLYALEKALYNAVYYNFNQSEIEDIIYKIREYINALDINSRVDYFTTRYPSVICITDDNGPYVDTSSPDSGTGDEDGYDGSDGDDLKDGTIPLTNWRSQMITISENGQTVIPNLNFNIGDVDIDTVLLEVQGDDPDYTTTGNGYHIIENTLYWHNFYDLKIGMVVKIRWRVE